MMIATAERPTLCDHCHCGQPMEEDLTFRLDMLSYGIDRHRFCCLSGHSVYTETIAPAVPHFPKGTRCCDVCGEPVAGITNRHQYARRRHERCRASRKEAKANV